MEIPAEDLKVVRNYEIYEEGYRVVCYYEKNHEALKGVYAKEISDFMSEFEENGAVPEFISKEDVIDRFLKKYKEALAVAIYNVSGTQIIRKERSNVNCKINNSEVFKEELTYDYGKSCFVDSYRIVYFYEDGHYYVGAYSTTIEGFMINFCDSYPILDESEIPKFISIDNLLNRYLTSLPNIIEVALYKTDGTCLAVKSREKKL